MSKNKSKKRQLNKAYQARLVSGTEAVPIYRESEQAYIKKMKDKGAEQYLYAMKKKQQLNDAQIEVQFMDRKYNTSEVKRAAIERHEILSQKQIDALDTAIANGDEFLMYAIEESDAQIELQFAIETMHGDPDEHAIALRQLIEAIGDAADGELIHDIFNGNS